MPPELHREVFCYCLPEDRDVRDMSTDTPLLLGQICNQWRLVSVGTSALWITLTALFLRNLYRHPKAAVKSMELWFLRSAGTPL
jgi:hypothetical protein